MGVIQRQGIKSMIVNFLGAIVGAFAMLYVYTSNDEIYGFAQALYGLVLLLMPLATLGIVSLTVKYYPIFEKTDPKRYNGLLTLLTGSLIIVFFIFALVFLGFKDSIFALLNSLNMKTDVFEGYEIAILALLFFVIFTTFLTNQSSNRLRTVVPNIITQLGYKLYLPLLVLAFAYMHISKTNFAFGLVLFFALATLALFIYLKLISGFSFGKVKRPSQDFSFKEMISYSLFGSLNQLSQTLAFRLDTVMIALFLPEDNVSFYFKAFIFTSFIEMPTRAIFQIANPIISQAWRNNDMIEMNKVYKKTSTNLFVMGCFLFLGIWYSIDDLVNISSDPTKFPHVKTIFLLLGASKLIEMMTSVNSYIIIYSKYYKFNLFFLVILGVGNLIMNYYLIPKYGIVGAAIATSISILVYNVLKLIFILYKFSLQPFTISTIKTLILFTGVFALSYIIPFEFSSIVNIIVKSIFVALIYLPIAYFWKISEDVNKLIIDSKNIVISKLWN